MWFICGDSGHVGIQTGCLNVWMLAHIMLPTIWIIVLKNGQVDSDSVESDRANPGWVGSVAETERLAGLLLSQ